MYIWLQEQDVKAFCFVSPQEQKKINPQELSTRAGRETMTVNEEDPARYPYHQQLFAAAKSGAW